MVLAPTSLLAYELRARLRCRYEALQRMAYLSQTMAPEPAWWHEALSCWWMTSSAVDRCCRSFRDGAEALVLLRTLARVDRHTCAEQVHAIWSPTMPAIPRPVAEWWNRTAGNGPLELGLAYDVAKPDDLVPITERVFGLEPCSEAFLRDFAWLQRVITARGPADTTRFHPLPVHLHVNVKSLQTHDLASVLRQILQAVIAQRLYARTTSNDDALEAAAASTRFEIVEIAMHEQDETTANVESLASLARLMQLGVRVRKLPAIGDIPDDSIETRLSVVNSLQVLVPSLRCLVPPEHCVEYFFASNDLPRHLIPAVFSSIQASASLERVEFLVDWNPFGFDDDVDDNGIQLDIPSLWKWAAYALLSCHAQNNVENVELHVDALESRVLVEVERVLRAENPLTELFDGAAPNECWIEASLFYLYNLEDATEDEDASLYRSPQPLRVRVINRLENLWRVLLPGRGEAWVKNDDARTEPPTRNDETIATPGERHPLRLLKLKGVVASNMNETLSVLRLVHREVLGIEVEAIGTMDDGFDMTDWTHEVLRLFPSLERLSLPWNADIDLQIFADAAEAGHGRLKSLSLNYDFCAESTDVLAFFDVLADMEHPITRTLEELSLHVSARNAPFDDEVNRYRPIEAFMNAWQRVLHHNRKLHTISLLLVAPTNVETDARPVVIWTGPLCIQSKLAFLSSVQHSHSGDRALGRLDTSVIATIFAFAARHRVRTFDIEFVPR